DRRGPWAVVPVAFRSRPGRRRAAHRGAAAHAAHAGTGRHRAADGGGRRVVRSHHQAPGGAAPHSVRSATAYRRLTGETRTRTRRHRKAGRELVTQQAAPDQTSQDARAKLMALRTEIAKAVVGQDSVVSGLVIALLCRGHVLLEGVPGVAKTLLVRAMAAALELDFKRVQFTPDLMPGDVTGSLVYDARTAKFEFRAGPVFTNLLLADEINRTPPKTQAALLEAMEERQVSVEGEARPLPDPFMPARTQTPFDSRAPTNCPRRSWTGSC